MPLSALTENNKTIYSFTFASALKIREAHSSLKCTCCGGEMFPRGRKGAIIHFVHKQKCTSPISSHPESLEHLSGKVHVYKMLLNETRGTNYRPEIEYRLSSCGQKGRIADIAVTLNGQPFLVFEIQLCSITADKIKERIDDYEQCGIESVWFLGKAADTNENRRYIYDRCGECYFINFDTKYIDGDENFFKAYFQ